MAKSKVRELTVIMRLYFTAPVARAPRRPASRAQTSSPPTLSPVCVPASLSPPQIHRSLPNSSWKAKGIKMPKRQRYMSQKGVDPKFLRNQRFVVKGIRKALVDGGAKKVKA